MLPARKVPRSEWRTRALDVSDNGKQSRDIVVVLDTKFDPGACMPALVEFVLSRLPRHHPAVFNYVSHGGEDLNRSYRYNAVSGTTTIRTHHEGVVLHHRAYVAIHLEHGTMHCDAPSLGLFGDSLSTAIVDEGGLYSGTMPQLPAATVAACLAANCCGKLWLAATLRRRWHLDMNAVEIIFGHLDRYPDVVRDNVSAIAVSAVSPEAMTYFWDDILHSSPSHPNRIAYTHRGLGPGRHPMWSLEDMSMTAGNGVAPFVVEWWHELANDRHPAETAEQAMEMMELNGDEPQKFGWETVPERSKQFQAKAWVELAQSVRPRRTL
jgi:hypothetical protein